MPPSDKCHRYPSPLFMYQRKQLGKRGEAASFCRASVQTHKYVQTIKNLEEVDCFLEILQNDFVPFFDLLDDAKTTHHVCSVFAVWQHEKARQAQFSLENRIISWNRLFASIGRHVAKHRFSLDESDHKSKILRSDWSRHFFHDFGRIFS